MITLDHFGLHWMEGGIGLLVQQAGAEHVLDLNMEFKVFVKKPRQGLVCPHNIRLDEAEYGELPDDELVRAMLPVPKTFGEPVLFVEQSPRMASYVNSLLRLSTSKHMVPLWSNREDIIGPLFQLTNVAPIVVHGYHPHYSQLLQKLVETAFYSMRQLILLGPPHMVLTPEVKRISVEPQDVSDLPLERIGAWHLKQRMLHND